MLDCRQQPAKKIDKGEDVRHEFVAIAAVAAVALIGYLYWRGTQDEAAFRASMPQNAAPAQTATPPAATPQNAPTPASPAQATPPASQTPPPAQQ
jgi:hypothetical protein